MSSPPKSKAWKWLAGCALSLGAVIVLIVVLSVAGYLWVATPGPQVDSEWFIGPETVGILHLDRAFEDEGVLQLVGSLTAELQEKQAELARREAPLMGRFSSFFGRSQESIEAKFKRDAPRQVTLILEDWEGADRPQPGLVVNLSRFPRLFRLGIVLYGWLADDVPQVEGFNLVPVERGAITFVENTLIWSGDGGVMPQILKRLARVPQDLEMRTHHPAGDGFADPRWDLFGSIENRGGAFTYALEWWKGALEAGLPPLDEFPGDRMESIQSLSLGVDFGTDDVSLVSARLRCRTTADCQMWKSLLEAKLSEIAGSTSTALKSYRIGGSGSLLEAELDLKGLREALIDLISRSFPLEDPSATGSP